MTPPTTESRTTEQLVDLARTLVTPGRRSLLGLTGAPGAGKSTLAEALVEALAGDAVLVSMDGFHLRDDELVPSPYVRADVHMTLELR